MTQPQLLSDPYAALTQPMPFMERLEHLFHVLREQLEGIDRFAIALFNPADNSVSSFMYESDDSGPLVGYSLPLNNIPSLQQLADQQAIRVVEDMRLFRGESQTSSHSEALLSVGLRSSFTMALRHDGQLLGFLFLNSRRVNYFTPAMLAHCNLWGHLVGQLLAQEQAGVRRIESLIRFATDMSGRRSVETDGHMRRMALFARMIARGLQSSHQLSDDYIEYLTLFAPMHDIGKVGIADAILHKPTRLTDDEFEQMQRHVSIGQDIVDTAIKEFSLRDMEHADMLRHIVLLHHEKLNGSGYMGCQGEEQIPLEARIVAVADILDALLNKRSYKEAWSVERSLQELQTMAEQHQLDSACVQIVLEQPDKVRDILQRFP